MKADIGKLGFWTWVDSGSYADCAELAQKLERLGYGALWIPEAVGRDPFIVLAALAKETSTLRLATGIANIYARDAMAMNAIRHSLNELSGGRLILGLGVSHPELLSDLRHHEYKKPLTAMRNYLEAMEQSLYMGPGVDDNGLVMLAALGDKMLGLAGEKADGAHPYFVTPEHTARAREILGPDKLLAPEQKILLIKEPNEARAVARQAMATYIGLKNYRNNLLNLGFSEEDFENGGSNRLVDAVVAWGDETTIRQRIEAHWANGADHVCIQALRKDGAQGFDADALEMFALL